MTLVLIHWLVAIVGFWEAWCAFQKLRTELLRAVIFGALGLIHGLVPAVGIPWYNRTPDPYDVHVEAGLYVLCGIVLLALGWRLSASLFQSTHAGQIFDYLASPELQPRLRKLFFICAAIGVAAWVGSIYASGATIQQAFSAKRLEFRGEGNGIMGGVCVHLLAAAFVPGFLGFFLKGRYRALGILYALGFAVLLYLGSRGTRAPAIGMIGSMIAGGILAQRISAERLLTYAAVIGVMAALAIGMYPLRHRMSQLSLGEMVSFLASREAYENALRQDPLNYHDHFVGVVACFPKLEPFVDGASYRRILFCYLPSKNFPELKPRDPNRIVAETLFGENDLDWMHPPSLYGDAFINFWGWSGILFLMFEGALIAGISRIVMSNPWWFLTLGPQLFYLAMIGLRGQPYTIALSMMSSLIIMRALMTVTKLPFHATGLRFPGSRPGHGSGIPVRTIPIGQSRRFSNAPVPSVPRRRSA